MLQGDFILRFVKISTSTGGITLVEIGGKLIVTEAASCALVAGVTPGKTGIALFNIVESRVDGGLGYSVVIRPAGSK